MNELQQVSLFGLSFNHIVLTIWRRKWVIAVFALLGLVAAQLGIMLKPPKYVASAQIIFDATAEQLVSSNQELRTSYGVHQIFQSAAALIESPGILKPVASKIISKLAGPLSSEPAIQKILLNPDLSEAERTAVLIERFQKNLTIKMQAANQLIVIEYRSGSPTEAAAVANLIAATFIEQRAASREASIAQATEWLDHRSSEAKDRLIAADKKIQDFKTKHHIEDEAGSSAIEAELTRARDQLSTLQTRLSETRSVYETLQTYARGTPRNYESLAERIGGATLDRLRSSLAEAQGALASAKARYGAFHPDVKAQESRVAILKAELSEEARRKQLTTKTEIEQLTSREQTLREDVRGLESKVHDLRASEVQLLELKREREATKTLYESMLSKVMEANVQQSLNFAQFRILLDATVPKHRKLPLALFWCGGIFLGILFGVFASILWELLQGPLVVSDHAIRQLPAKFVTQLPIITEKDLGGAHEEGKNHYKSFAKTYPQSLFTNKLLAALLPLRTVGAGEACRIIMITSPRQGCGKTHISANLAGLSVFLGKRTLLVDIDARKKEQDDKETGAPKCSELESFIKATRLQEVFTAERSEAGDYDVLRIMPANEAACLRFFQAQTAGLFDFLRKNYDHVWVDTPPAGVFNDPLVLAGQVDGVIIVVEWFKTTMWQLKETFKLVLENGGSTLGIIINKVRVDALISESMASYDSYYDGGKSRPRAVQRNRAAPLRRE